MVAMVSKNRIMEGSELVRGEVGYALPRPRSEAGGFRKRNARYMQPQQGLLGGLIPLFNT